MSRPEMSGEQFQTCAVCGATSADAEGEYDTATGAWLCTDTIALALTCNGCAKPDGPVLRMPVLADLEEYRARFPLTYQTLRSDLKIGPGPLELPAIYKDLELANPDLFAEALGIAAWRSLRDDDLLPD